MSLHRPYTCDRKHNLVIPPNYISKKEFHISKCKTPQNKTRRGAIFIFANNPNLGVFGKGSLRQAKPEILKKQPNPSALKL